MATVTPQDVDDVTSALDGFNEDVVRLGERQKRLAEGIATLGSRMRAVEGRLTKIEDDLKTGAGDITLRGRIGKLEQELKKLDGEPFIVAMRAKWELDEKTAEAEGQMDRVSMRPPKSPMTDPAPSGG